MIKHPCRLCTPILRTYAMNYGVAKYLAKSEGNHEWVIVRTLGQRLSSSSLEHFLLFVAPCASEPFTKFLLPSQCNLYLLRCTRRQGEHHSTYQHCLMCLLVCVACLKMCWLYLRAERRKTSVWLCSMSFTSAELSDTLRLGHSVELLAKSKISGSIMWCCNNFCSCHDNCGFTACCVVC